MARLTEKQKHILRRKLCDMKRRCNNPENEFYKDYGGRGIKVCEEWMDKKNGHANFQRWAIESGWKEFLSIDRIDVNGNYEPSNCRWATPKEQAINRRTTIYTTINGVTKTTQEWAEQIGITERAFLLRLEYGWDEARLLEPKYKPLKMTKAEMSKEIRMWRKLEEQGLLIRLPCKVGDTVYEICNDCTYSCTEEEEYGDCTECPYSKMNIHEQVFVSVGIIADNMDKFGKTVFLTREEAEKALERMNKNA